jgi:hypothetical protein
LPPPVVAANVTIRIHTGWLILFSRLPKFTVTVLLEKVPLTVVIGAGLVVTVENSGGFKPVA